MDFHKECINNAVIRNPDILEILDQYSELVQSIELDATRQWPRHELPHRDNWMSEDYLKRIVHMGRGHEGYPETLVGFGTSAKELIHDSREEFLRITKESDRLTQEIGMFLGAHRTALAAVYPPGGFIPWHTNANAAGYNIIFTWSEKGDGYWEHLDPVTKEVVRIPDVKGWQCKFGYYGTYDEPNQVLYHAASTNCLRATLGFVFNRDERGKNMASMVVEEIQTA